MGYEQARAHLEKFGADSRILNLGTSIATVALAAEAIGCEPARIAKTLSFYREGGCIMVVAAGDMRIDNAKFKAEFGIKAKMLSPEDALALTGHAVGGVCPFGVNDGAEVFLDESLKRFKTVFPACGSAETAIELELDELERFTGFKGWVECTKPVNNE